MDPRPTRRDAEKAARDLLNARATYIGDLRVALDDIDAGDDLIRKAGTDAERILTDARDRAAKTIADAQAVLDRRRTTYTTAYKTALDAGWKPAELSTLGFTTTTANPKKRTPPATAPQA